MGVRYSALLFYGETVKKLGLDIDVLTESDDWGLSEFEGWDIDFTDSYSGPCEDTTIIGIDCNGKTLDEIIEVRDKFHEKFKERFEIEPKLISEGVVS